MSAGQGSAPYAIRVSASSLPRHNSSTGLPSELPAELLSTPPHLGMSGRHHSTLQPLYDSPYAILRIIRVGSHEEVVVVRRLKACMAADATPGSPPRRVSFSDPLVSSPSSSPAPPPKKNGPRTVFLSDEEVFARQDRRCLHSLHRHGTRPVNGHRPRGWTSDLFSFQPMTKLRISPVENWLHPW